MPSEGLEPTATVTCTVTKTNGGILSATMSVMFYQPDAKIGDYMYYDGTYSTVLNTQKEVIGIVVDVDDTGKHGYIVNLEGFGIYRLTSVTSGSNPSNRFYDVPIEVVTTIDGNTTSISFTTDNIKSFIFNDDNTIKQYTSGAMSKDMTDQTLLLAQSSKKYVESLGRIYPTTLEEFNQYKIDYPTDYENICVPAFMATIYEPTVKSILNPKFNKGNWRMCDIKLGSRLLYLVITEHASIINNILIASGECYSPILAERMATGRDRFQIFGKNTSGSYGIRTGESHTFAFSFKLVCKF